MSNTSAWRFPTARCSVPNVITSHSAAQNFSAAAIMSSDNKATVPPVVPVTSSGIVYHLNPSSEPNNFGGAVPINVFFSTESTSIGGTEILPARGIATPRTDLAVFTIQDVAQLLASP